MSAWEANEPATVTGNEQAMVLWDMQINTDREMPGKPDIVIKDHNPNPKLATNSYHASL